MSIARQNINDVHRLPRRPMSVALVALGVVFFCYFPIMVLRIDQKGPSLQFASNSKKQAAPMSLQDAINSATGTLFLGEPIRQFEEERFFSMYDGDNKGSNEQSPPTDTCDKWNVVTTIFAPSEGVKRAAKVSGWCTVIVADTKTPQDYMEQAGLVGMESVVHYLSVQDQIEWLERENHDSGMSAVGKFLTAIPYKHFARKNIGYLYAIQHGAKLLFDFDDDNLLPIDPTTGQVFPPMMDEKQLTNARMVLTGPTAFNHHPLMGATVNNSWARGFPLQYIQDTTTQGQIAYDNVDLDLQESVGVMQFCANGNPDIDAIHRLVHPLPMTFEPPNIPLGTPGYSAVSTTGSLVVPSHAFAPYNAQATVHTYKALWALLLPFTVPGRVSDIWRGYFAEALFRDIGLSVTFLPPAIVQDRNEHDYLADMQAELDLYFKGGKLLEFLSGWDCPADSIPERMETLWIELYERGYIELNDVKVVQLWLAALVEINYDFPSLQRRRLDHTILMGQFNFAQNNSEVLFWNQKWRQWFNKIVIRGPFSDSQRSELEKHGIIVLEGRADKGINSPIENLAATLQDFKAVDGVTGVLYAHDDLLLNVTNLFGNFAFGTNRLLVTHSGPKVDPEKTFNINGDGTFSKPNGFQTTNKEQLIESLKWPHAKECVDGFQQVFADPRSKSMLQKDGSLQVPKGQSDVMYVPTTLADEFASLAQLMVDHNIFLECGLPTIVETLHRTMKVEVEYSRICTSWDYKEIRGKMKMLEMCQLPTSIVHPVKLTLGLSSWNRAFEWITMGKSEFKV